MQKGPMSSRRLTTVRERAQRSLLWQVWERLLEVEFVDRSVALAGKAFVAFFPLVIVVAAFMSQNIREAIFTTITSRLGVRGPALDTTAQAFASSEDVRRATGVLGLVLMIFFATSFTTALQRVYLRAWRRPPGKKVHEYIRGPGWYLVVLAYLALVGGLRELLSDGPQLVLFGVLSLAATSALWWFTAWFMLLGQVRWRVVIPAGVITGVALTGFAISATVWMPEVVIRNQEQFGYFGVALALVTWFSSAAICILVGACAGAVFAADGGRVGSIVRGPNDSLLIEGAEPSLPGLGQPVGDDDPGRRVPA